MKQSNAQCIWMRTQSCHIWEKEENCPKKCRIFINMNEGEGLELKKSYADDLQSLKERLRGKWEMMFNYYLEGVVSQKQYPIRGECVK
jgi:hypothetical protein